MEAEAIVGQLVDAVTAEHVIATEVRHFLQRLLDEGLIIPASDGSVISKAGKLPTQEVVRKHFVQPTIEKYSDMQGLLLVDPIHEVDATGWPAVDPKGR